MSPPDVIFELEEGKNAFFFAPDPTGKLTALPAGL